MKLPVILVVMLILVTAGHIWNNDQVRKNDDRIQWTNGTIELEKFERLHRFPRDTLAVDDECVADLYPGLEYHVRELNDGTFDKFYQYEGSEESITLNRMLIEGECAMPGLSR